MLLPPCSKKLHKWGRTCLQSGIRIHKIPFWAQGRKDNNKKHNNQHTLCQKTSPEGEPRTWFSHPKMHPGGFSGPLGSKTPPHGPKTPPNYDFLLICVPSGLICRRFLVHIVQKKFAMWLLIGVRSGMHFFNKTWEHWKWNKQVGWHAADILGTVAGLPKAIG